MVYIRGLQAWFDVVCLSGKCGVHGFQVWFDVCLSGKCGVHTWFTGVVCLSGKCGVHGFQVWFDVCLSG